MESICHASQTLAVVVLLLMYQSNTLALVQFVLHGPIFNNCYFKALYKANRSTSEMSNKISPIQIKLHTFQFDSSYIAIQSNSVSRFPPENI